MKFLSLFAFLVLFAFQSKAQSTSEKAEWGVVSSEELGNEAFEKYKDHDAVFISGYGEYLVSSGNLTTLRRHFRIKILSKQGLGEANISIDDNLATLHSIEAISYHLKDGQVIRTVLQKDQIFQQGGETRFAVPNVKVGSVIEYRYTRESTNFGFTPIWSFQSTIPTIRSEFKLVRFQSTIAGYGIMLEGARLIKKYGDSQKRLKSWVLEDIPALPIEPYLPNLTDYFNRLRVSIAFNTPKTWNTIAKEYRHHPYFGEQLAKSNAINNILNDLITEAQTPQEKMEAIFTYCQNNFEWNGKRSVYARKSDLRDNLKAKTNTSGGINLLLIAMLQQANLVAHPVLISTRKHGKVFKDVFSKQQFNHTIASVEVEGKSYLLDAFQNYNSINTLPIADLNEIGLRLKKGKADWIPLSSTAKNKTVSSWNINLTDLNTPTFKAVYQYKGIPADQTRKGILKNPADAPTTHALRAAGFTIQSSQLPDVTESTSKMGMSYELKAVNEYDSEAPLLYITPLVAPNYQKNPFINPTRLLPIRFAYAYKKQFISSIQLPEGYEVEALPEAIRLELPNKMMTFTYQSKLVGNRLQIIALIQLNQTEIHARDYAVLREFYNRIIEKINESVVLKKVE